MSNQTPINGTQFDVSIPTSTIIHNNELAERLRKNWTEGMEVLRTECPSLGNHSVAVDEYGRVIIHDAVFNSNIRKILDEHIRTEGDTNYCGCNNGNCLACGCGS